MTGPIEVDATVKAMVELINRVARDTAFRRLCETDMAAALAELGSAPAEGVTFDYLHDADGHRLRVERGGVVTTCVLTGDGDFRLDSESLGTVVSRDELSDEELLAVAGAGSAEGCAATDFRCQAYFSCLIQQSGLYPGWQVHGACYEVNSTLCIAARPEMGVYQYVPC